MPNANIIVIINDIKKTNILILHKKLSFMSNIGINYIFLEVWGLSSIVLKIKEKGDKLRKEGMNWYKNEKMNKQASYDMYGQPLDFKEKVEAPLYQDLLNENQMEWYSQKQEDYVKGPTKDYMLENKNMKGEIVYMSPDEYINECVSGAKVAYERDDVSFDELKEEIIKWRRMSTSKDGGSRLDEYKDRWIGGEQPYMGYIIYRNGNYYGQEGMHRALMARDLGVRTIPVLIVNKGVENELV